jgi:hypothetical protein
VSLRGAKRRGNPHPFRPGSARLPRRFAPRNDNTVNPRSVLQITGAGFFGEPSWIAFPDDAGMLDDVDTVGVR